MIFFKKDYLKSGRVNFRPFILQIVPELFITNALQVLQYLEVTFHYNQRFSTLSTFDLLP